MTNACLLQQENDQNVASEVVVRAVQSRRDQERFIRLPLSLYANDPQWVPPLLFQVRDRLNSTKNAYHEHAEVACFLAEREGQVVGRVSAQVCELAQDAHGHGTGHFGFFECEDRVETAKALFQAAESWLGQRGMTRLLGPFDLTINDEVGLLVDGFDSPPYVMMGHHHPYYGDLLTEVGLMKEMDLHAYFLDISRPYTDRIQRIVDRASRDSRIVIRPIDKKAFELELRQALELFKDAWKDNWGYVPPTGAEVDHLIQQMRQVLDRGSVVFAEVDGELAGFMIALPNLNEFIRDLKGELYPFGWLRLLWRLRYSNFRSVRVPLMGITKKYQSSRIGASIALSMIDRCRAEFLPLGVSQCEMSWILDNNLAMRGILDAAGCESYKRYRIYSKAF